MPIPAPKAAGTAGASGRRFVVLAVLAVLLLWGSLYLAFRHWRAGYRERQMFGERRVAAAIDPLDAIVPADECPPEFLPSGCAGVAVIGTAIAAAMPLPEATPETWRRAVAETHAMLVTLTAANVLDQTQLITLSHRVADLVSRARPPTARAELAALWDEVEARAGPIVRSRHSRPALLPPFWPKDDRTPESSH